MSSISSKKIRRFSCLASLDENKFNLSSSCEVFDLPPINSYHRLLAHKMAEYYRLTHVADATGGSVRLCRGQYARMYESPPNQSFLVNLLT